MQTNPNKTASVAAVGKMNTSNRKIMDGSRINSIIYRIGACLIVSSLLMSAVSASKQICKYRLLTVSKVPEELIPPSSSTLYNYLALVDDEGSGGGIGGGRSRRGLSAGNLMGKCALCCLSKMTSASSWNTINLRHVDI